MDAMPASMRYIMNGAKENPKKRELKENHVKQAKEVPKRCKGKSQETGIERQGLRVLYQL